MHKKIELLDTTLRDGEQTNSVSFTPFEKLQIANYLLEKLNVSRVEIASARVSPLEKESAKKIFEWATKKKFLDRVEILGFIDGGLSIDWLRECGGKTINFLSKGSRLHCEKQLKMTLKEHLTKIEENVEAAKKNNLNVNIYLEDWSNGFLYSPDYVKEMLSVLTQLPIHKFFLPDTLGIMMPEEVARGVSSFLDSHPDVHVEFHGHNDYSLATANCIAAVEAGVSGLHVSVNGLGERAGNSPLESVVTVLHDKLKVKTSVVENAIMGISRLVETFSGKRVQANRPIVGLDVYTQTAGIHADGDRKANLYANPILPERFGRKRSYSLGKMSGKASISNNLKILGMELEQQKQALLLKKVKELGESKKNVTIDDLPFLVQDIFGEKAELDFYVDDFLISTTLKKKPRAKLSFFYKGEKYEGDAEGDGGYDAFMNTLKKAIKKVKGFPFTIPILADYEVRIPPGGKTDALVEAVIRWETEDKKSFTTTGIDTDQLRAAIKATERMINRVLLKAKATK